MCVCLYVCTISKTWLSDFWNLQLSAWNHTISSFNFQFHTKRNLIKDIGFHIETCYFLHTSLNPTPHPPLPITLVLILNWAIARDRVLQVSIRMPILPAIFFFFFLLKNLQTITWFRVGHWLWLAFAGICLVSYTLITTIKWWGLEFGGVTISSYSLIHFLVTDSLFFLILCNRNTHTHTHLSFFTIFLSFFLVSLSLSHINLHI